MGMICYCAMGMICFPSANRFSRHCRNGVCPNVTADPINSSLCLALVMATLIRLQSCNSIPVCRWKTRDKTSTYLFLVHPCMHCTCKLAMRNVHSINCAVLKWFLFTSKSTYTLYSHFLSCYFSQMTPWCISSPCPDTCPQYSPPP